MSRDTGAIAAAIEARAGRAGGAPGAPGGATGALERTRGRQRGLADVAARDADAADVELAGNAGRGQAPSRVQDVGLPPGERPADRDLGQRGDALSRKVAHRRVDRDLGRAVRVQQSREAPDAPLPQRSTSGARKPRSSRTQARGNDVADARPVRRTTATSATREQWRWAGGDGHTPALARAQQSGIESAIASVLSTRVAPRVRHGKDILHRNVKTVRQRSTRYVRCGVDIPTA